MLKSRVHQQTTLNDFLKTPELKTPSKSQLIKEALDHLYHVDCFIKVVDSKHWLGQVAWLLFFVVFSGATAWLVLLSLLNYFEYELVSKIEVINERPAQFPAITICSSNPFSSEQSQSLIEKIVDESIGVDYFANLTYWEAYYQMTNLTHLAKMFVQTSAEYAQKGNKSTLGFNLHNVTQNCMFNQKWCSWYYEENIYTDFNWYYSFDYGNCYQFNAGLNASDLRVNSQKVNREGVTFGLSLWIGPLLNGNSKYPIAESKGLKVFIHNQSYAPSFSKGVNVNVGAETNLAISRSYSRNFPRPYSDCVDLDSSQSEMYAYIRTNLSQAYRQQDCLDLCFQKKIMANCACYYPKYAQMEPDSPPCLNLTQLDCIHEQYSNLDEDPCSMYECPLECETITYDVEVSSLKYPSRETYELLLQQAQGGVAFYEDLYNMNFSAYDLYADNFLVLNVYYASTQYTRITETPKMLPIDLFANIGGTMGIFLGLSVYHLVETVEILLIIAFILFKK